MKSLMQCYLETISLAEENIENIWQSMAHEAKNGEFKEDHYLILADAYADANTPEKIAFANITYDRVEKALRWLAEEIYYPYTAIDNQGYIFTNSLFISPGQDHMLNSYREIDRQNIHRQYPWEIPRSIIPVLARTPGAIPTTLSQVIDVRFDDFRVAIQGLILAVTSH